MRKVVFDTNIFNKLVILSLDEILKIRNKFELFVTDVSIKELNRMKDEEKKEQIFKLIKEHFKPPIDAGIFSFASYADGVREDSATGFARYNETQNRGRMLRYEDGKVAQEIGLERNKISKGTAFNDAAIALAVPKDAIFITDEQKGYGNKLKQLGIDIMSFDEFKRDFF